MTRVYSSGGGGVFGAEPPRPKMFGFRRLSPEIKPAPFIYTNAERAEGRGSASVTAFEEETEAIAPGHQRQVFAPAQYAKVKNYSLTMPSGAVFTPREQITIPAYKGSKRKTGMIGFKKARTEVLNQDVETFYPEDKIPYPSDMPGDIRPVGPYELPEGTPYVSEETSAEGLDDLFGDTLRVGDDVPLGQETTATKEPDTAAKILEYAKKLGISTEKVESLVKSGDIKDLLSKFTGKKPKTKALQETPAQDPAKPTGTQTAKGGLETWHIVAMAGGGVLIVGLIAMALMKKKQA